MSDHPITESWAKVLNEEYKAITERMAEHQRLKDAVVVAAKAWRDGSIYLSCDLVTAVDTLNQFERENNL